MNTLFNLEVLMFKNNIKDVIKPQIELVLDINIQPIETELPISKKSKQTNILENIMDDNCVDYTIDHNIL